MLYHGSEGLLEKGQHLRLAEDRHLVVILDELLQGVLITFIQIEILSGIKLLRPVEKLQGIPLCVVGQETGQESAKGYVIAVLLLQRFSIEAVEGLAELKHSLNCLLVPSCYNNIQIYQ